MTDQLTPMQEGEYVEARWMYVALHDWRNGKHGGFHLRIGMGEEQFNGPNEAEVFHAAFLYTKEHERKIADVAEEIEYCESFGWITHRSGKREKHPVWTRILAVEQSRLAELMRGWKGEA